MPTCPVCLASLPRRATQCASCGTLIPLDDAPRRRRGDEEQGMFPGQLLGWGDVAFVITYLVSVPAVFAHLHFVVRRWGNVPWDYWVTLVLGDLYLAMFPAALAAMVVWMIVDSIQATWNWLNDPRGREVPWRNWWAGPIRAILFVGALIGLGIAFFVPPPRSNVVDLVCLTGVFSFLAAFTVTLVVRAA